MASSRLRNHDLKGIYRNRANRAWDLSDGDSSEGEIQQFRSYAKPF